jgi:hypothetical protein
MAVMRLICRRDRFSATAVVGMSMGHGNLWETKTLRMG